MIRKTIFFGVALPILLLPFFLLPATAHGAGSPLDEARDLIKQHVNYDRSVFLLTHYVEANRQNAEAHYLLGLLYQSMQNYGQARVQLQTAVDLDASKSEYHLLLGRSLCAGLKANDVSMLSKIYLAYRARNEFERAAELAPDSIAAHKALVTFYSQAPAIYGGERHGYQEAAILKRLSPAEGHFAAAEILMMADRHTEAHQELHEGIQAAPYAADTYVSASRLLLQHGMDDMAAPFLEKALQYDPATDYAAYHLSQVYVLEGRNLSIAEHLLRQFMLHWHEENNPTMDRAHWVLGLLYAHTGRLDEAQKEEEIALTQNPGSKQAKDVLAEIVRLRAGPVLALAHPQSAN